jgi:hypothetical protein
MAYNAEGAGAVYFGNGAVYYANGKFGQEYVRCVRGAQYPTNNFVDNGETVTDTSYGLMWQKGENSDMNWPDALSYCEGLTLDRYSDWRLPNVKELESILDVTRDDPAIDPIFSNAFAYLYWTSSSYSKLPSLAWYVNFYEGGVAYGDGSKLSGYYNDVRFRCVRNVNLGFADIPRDHWAYNYIYSIYHAGITTGYADGTYRPSLNVTRAQMAAFIIRAKYGEGFSYSSTPHFMDVPNTHWAFKYIQKMYEDGITTGYSDGTYRPAGNVTRGQMAAFIVRGKFGETFPYSTTPYFSDVPESHGSFKYIQKVTEEGIASGYSDGTYRPSQYVNRAQMAAFIAKAFLGME